jgi:hypothetical protein
MITFERHEFEAPQASAESAGSACVEIACRAGVVEFRDSKVPFESPADQRLTFSAAQFESDLHAVRTGVAPTHLRITELADGWFEFGTDTAPAILLFTAAEVAAFHEDIRLGRYAARLAAA